MAARRRARLGDVRTRLIAQQLGEQVAHLSDVHVSRAIDVERVEPAHAHALPMSLLTLMSTPLSLVSQMAKTLAHGLKLTERG